MLSTDLHVLKRTMRPKAFDRLLAKSFCELLAESGKTVSMMTGDIIPLDSCATLAIMSQPLDSESCTGRVGINHSRIGIWLVPDIGPTILRFTSQAEDEFQNWVQRGGLAQSVKAMPYGGRPAIPVDYMATETDDQSSLIWAHSHFYNRKIPLYLDPQPPFSRPRYQVNCDWRNAPPHKMLQACVYRNPGLPQDINRLEGAMNQLELPMPIDDFAFYSYSEK